MQAAMWMITINMHYQSNDIVTNQSRLVREADSKRRILQSLWFGER